MLPSDQPDCAMTTYSIAESGSAKLIRTEVDVDMTEASEIGSEAWKWVTIPEIVYHSKVWANVKAVERLAA